MNSKQGSSYIKSRMGNELKNKIFEYNGIITEEREKKKPSIQTAQGVNLLMFLKINTALNVAIR